MVRGLRVHRKKKEIARCARSGNFGARADDNLAGNENLLKTRLESFGEKGLGVQVLLFEVGVENHGEVADEDAA
jgi:hypothetical protein